MTIRDLRAQHAHALKMLRCTNGNRGWARAVARLNLEIMMRTRPCRTNSGGHPRGEANPISMDKQRDSRMRDVFLFADDGKKTQTSGAERAT